MIKMKSVSHTNIWQIDGKLHVGYGKNEWKKSNFQKLMPKNRGKIASHLWKQTIAVSIANGVRVRTKCAQFYLGWRLKKRNRLEQWIIDRKYYKWFHTWWVLLDLNGNVSIPSIPIESAGSLLLLSSHCWTIYGLPILREQNAILTNKKWKKKRKNWGNLWKKQKIEEIEEKSKKRKFMTNSSLEQCGSKCKYLKFTPRAVKKKRKKC